MRQLRVPRRWLQPLGLLSVLAVVLVAGCGGPYPQSTLDPRGDFAQMVDAVFSKTVYLATIVFVLVEGALLWAVFKFRGKPDDAEPHQIHGSTVVEIVWTIIPAVVLAIVAVPTVQTIFRTAEVPASSPDGQPPLKVEVVGHQWFWEFRYPELGITTANELHVPVNRTVDLRMKSIDVIHSFWVPQFAGKRDVFPNRETRLWFTAKVTGAFPGACAEFCGTEHGRMDFYLMVDSPDSFKAFVNRRLSDTAMAYNGLPMGATAATAASMMPVPATAQDSLVAHGRQLFTAKACTTCHSISSMHLLSTIGPNLSGIGTRKMIGAGWLPNTDANLRDWIEHTQKVKPDVKMVLPLPVSDDDVTALIAYLRTMR
ncbi:MAG TPA: cytochrome c oxidase subunit II [Gemmatimonadales bacterium]|jgi:cytochrome c oxidase subunit 2